MAKPFKSEFDLIAEAYGTISYKKQAIINEHTSARSVIGYPPQIINEEMADPEEELPEYDDNPGGGSTPVHPDEAAEGTEKSHKYTVIENDKEGSIQPMEYRQPEGDLIKTVKSGGIVKKCYQHPEGREWAVESDRPIDFNQEGSWTWDEDA